MLTDRWMVYFVAGWLPRLCRQLGIARGRGMEVAMGKAGSEAREGGRRRAGGSGGGRGAASIWPISFPASGTARRSFWKFRTISKIFRGAPPSMISTLI